MGISSRMPRSSRAKRKSRPAASANASGTTLLAIPKLATQKQTATRINAIESGAEDVCANVPLAKRIRPWQSRRGWPNLYGKDTYWFVICEGCAASVSSCARVDVDQATTTEIYKSPAAAGVRISTCPSWARAADNKAEAFVICGVEFGPVRKLQRLFWQIYSNEDRILALSGRRSPKPIDSIVRRFVTIRVIRVSNPSHPPSVAAATFARRKQHYFLEFLGGSSRMNDQETSAVWPLS